MEFKPYIVYVKTDDVNCITAIDSSAFIRYTDGWTEIDRGFGDKYHHAQGNYFDKPIRDGRGICRYKLVDDEVRERTADEMDADYTPPGAVPTQLDRIDAQALYTALMTDTLIEEV